jgi:endoglucanase
MDHPGFEALGPNRAEFLGGVPDAMFRGRPGVRFQTATGVVRAQVRRAEKKQVELTGGALLRGGELGQWDLPAFQLRGDRLTAGGIDDVLGVVAGLAALTEIVRRRIQTPVWCLFTRAEEVGFHGALIAARRGLVPRRSLVVSLEMSRERPWARQGDGPIIRVGDRLTVFDPAATLSLEHAARQEKVRAQRCLMDGGTCEASAFAANGYRCGGLCLALGNYHNIGPGQRPAAEYVSVKDLAGLVVLIVAAARQWRGFERATVVMRRKVKQIERTAPRRLTDV